MPFIFSMGYGLAGVPLAFEEAPVVVKPFQDHDLRRALNRALQPKLLKEATDRLSGPAIFQQEVKSRQ